MLKGDEKVIEIGAQLHVPSNWGLYVFVCLYSQWIGPKVSKMMRRC